MAKQQKPRGGTADGDGQRPAISDGVEISGSGLRPRAKPPTPAMEARPSQRVTRPPEHAAARRLVLFLTKDDDAAARFEAPLVDRARVLRLDDVFELLEATRHHGHDEPVVVIDGRRRIFRPETIAALAGTLPEEAEIVLWALPDHDLAELELAAPARRFVILGEDSSVEDVAWMCRPAVQSDVPPSPLARPRVLVLDDDETYARSLSRLFTASGYDVTVCHDGRRALDACRKLPFSAIITDLCMPGMTGVSFASLVRLALGDDTPPIVLTTGTLTEHIDTSSVDAVVSKPEGPTELLRALEELIQEGAAESS